MGQNLSYHFQHVMRNPKIKAISLYGATVILYCKDERMAEARRARERKKKGKGKGNKIIITC